MVDSVQEVSASHHRSEPLHRSTPHVEDLFSRSLPPDVLAIEFAQQATERLNNDFSLLGPVSIRFVADSTETAGT